MPKAGTWGRIRSQQGNKVVGTGVKKGSRKRYAFHFNPGSVVIVP